jgi:hypothetical protein
MEQRKKKTRRRRKEKETKKKRGEHGRNKSPIKLNKV